mgnify:CR=1 FL=1
MKCVQEQMDLSNIRVDETANKNRKNRSKWRNGMQAYCDRQQINGRADKDGWCACGYMNMCYYCNGADITKACVDAIEEMCYEKKISIEYSRTDYEKQLKDFEQ